jgi:hypothetical protein
MIASLAAALVSAWLAADVHFNRNGNWTGLYCTGGASPTPPQLGNEDIHVIPNDRGYDGQFYHYAAHDPFLTRGFKEHVDNPALRWRRILVPVLAWGLALGSDVYVDSLFVAVTVGFLWLGVFWLASYAKQSGLHATWGLGFLFVPAVLVSLDRLTIDLALAALAVAFVLRPRARALVLIAAPLVRETGALLAVAASAVHLLRREYRQTAQAVACLLPAAAWWSYVAARTTADHTPWLGLPSAGLIARTFDAPVIPQTSAWMRMAARLEWVALAGIWLAFGLAVYFVVRHWREAALSCEVAFCVVWLAFASVLGKADIWADAYAAGRTMSPLLVVLAMMGLRSRAPLYGLPIVLVLPRILLQYQPAWKGVLRGILQS